MGLQLILLMMLQLPPVGSVETRIVESPKVPVSLVGLPCGEREARVVARNIETQDSDDSLIESEPFRCEFDCAVGIRVNGSARVKSIRIGMYVVYDRSRSASFFGPPLLASKESCNNEQVYRVLVPKLEWPLDKSFIFVSEVTLEDGATWRADSFALTGKLRNRWQPVKKRGHP